MTRRSMFGKTRFSSLFMIDPGLPNLSYLGILALILTLPFCGCGVEGISFAFNGFQGISDVHVVPDSPWIYYPNDSSIYLDPTNSLPGRFLYPHLLQVMDPVSKTTKSFSTTFIFQIWIEAYYSGTQSGMAFIMVLDNFTIGAPQDYLGLITANTSKTVKYYESDDHTFGVELDTYQNPEFNDPNDNHIGIDLANMNSTGGTFIPTIALASTNPNLYLQIWIDYFQVDSRMDIFLTQYGQDKPTTPLGPSKRLDLSILNENMYIGFSAAVGTVSSNQHAIMAWSFSNEGTPAPHIWIAKDAPPAPSPPPPAPPPRETPPPPPSTPPPPSPVAAPNPSPNAPVPASSPAPSPPVSLPPPPIIITPPPIYAPSPPPPVPSNPAPYNPPGPSPPVIFPPPGPSTVTPSSTPKSLPVSSIAGIVFGAVFGGVILLIFCWKIYRAFAHPILFFLAHSAGKDESTKNFTARLRKEMTSTWRYKFYLIKVFFDRKSLPKGQPFPEQIQKALDITRVGVVIVTEDFFERKWPMTELLSFVESMSRNPKKVRILPLFYGLKVGEVKDKLTEEFWDEKWSQMSTNDHPIDRQKCIDAVKILCKINGVQYTYDDRSHEEEYIKSTLKEVSKMFNQMVVWS